MANYLRGRKFAEIKAGLKHERRLQRLQDEKSSQPQPQTSTVGRQNVDSSDVQPKPLSN